jgi:hypothetical protein
MVDLVMVVILVLVEVVMVVNLILHLLTHQWMVFKAPEVAVVEVE